MRLEARPIVRYVRPNAATDRFYAWITFAIAGTLLFGFSLHTIGTLLGSDGYPFKVFGSFWASGFAAEHGLNPYDVYSLTFHIPVVLHGKLIVVNDVSLSPPCMLPLFAWTSRIKLRDGVAWWTILSVLMFMAVPATLLAFRGITQKRQIIFLVLSSSVFYTLWLGQDYSLFLLLACVVWLLTSIDRSDAAAVLVGILVAIKPNLLFWPVMLFLASYKRQAIIAGLTALGLAALPVFLYGPTIYKQWFWACRNDNHNVFPSDISISGFFTRMGLYPVGFIAAAAVALSLLFFVWRTRPNQSELAGIAICAAILCSPLSWYYYILIAAPFLATLGRWGKLETLAAFLIVLPDMFHSEAMAAAGHVFITVVCLPHLVGLVLCLASFMRPGIAYRCKFRSSAYIVISA